MSASVVIVDQFMEIPVAWVRNIFVVVMSLGGKERMKKIYRWNTIQKIASIVDKPWWMFWKTREKLAIEWLDEYNK